MTDTTEKKRRVDWDAVERDYRTGQFTEQELADKHGATRSAVSKQKRVKGWTKDLKDEIRHATQTRLVAELVAKGSEKVADAVLAVAEVNTRVVLGHRKRIADLHRLAEDAQAKLEEMGATLVDVREAGVFVQAVNGLASITKTLIEQERKAFGLDDEVKKGNDTIEELLMAIANEG